jgi:lipoprotein-anchoring transpeptidase ErfK/SrfK
MISRLATAQSTVAIWHWPPAAIVTLTAVAALTTLTAGAAPKQARPAQPQEATAPRDAGEPIMAIVSIKAQQVVLYDADGWILRAPVSTGTKERETPAGVFAVVDKEVDHRSNMYDDAWMPHMQRITWNGIALHGGPLPGYAASHGCVRMPFGFADKLFNKTRRMIQPRSIFPTRRFSSRRRRPSRLRRRGLRRSPARPRRPQRRPTKQRNLPRQRRARRHRSLRRCAS